MNGESPPSCPPAFLSIHDDESCEQPREQAAASSVRTCRYGLPPFSQLVVEHHNYNVESGEPGAPGFAPSSDSPGRSPDVQMRSLQCGSHPHSLRNRPLPRAPGAPILVVDDNDDSVGLLVTALERASFSTKQASSGEDALEPRGEDLRMGVLLPMGRQELDRDESTKRPDPHDTQRTQKPLLGPWGVQSRGICRKPRVQGK